MHKIFRQAILVAFITFVLDFTFHWLFTKPMETLTYFIIKFLLSFFVAVGLFNLKKYYRLPQKRIIFSIMAALIFSTLMSTYYRAWELIEAGVPFGTRSPDIVGITRYSFLFVVAWWLAHATFFFIGTIVVSKLFRQEK